MLDICVENNDQLSVLQQEEVKINTFCDTDKEDISNVHYNLLKGL